MIKKKNKKKKKIKIYLFHSSSSCNRLSKLRPTTCANQDKWPQQLIRKRLLRLWGLLHLLLLHSHLLQLNSTEVKKLVN